MVLSGKKLTTPTSTITRHTNKNPTPLSNVNLQTINTEKPGDSNQPKCLCTVCNKEVRNGDKAVECDCSRWWHARCALITDKQYNALAR